MFGPLGKPLADKVVEFKPKYLYYSTSIYLASHAVHTLVFFLAGAPHPTCTRTQNFCEIRPSIFHIRLILTEKIYIARTSQFFLRDLHFDTGRFCKGQLRHLCTHAPPHRSDLQPELCRMPICMRCDRCSIL